MKQTCPLGANQSEVCFIADVSTPRGFLARMLAVISLAAWMACCHLLAGAGEALKIGLLLPPEEPQLASVREGVLLAQEEVNKSSIAAVQLLIRGRVGQWGADAVEAARLATDDGVDGLIAPPDGAASHLVLQVSGRTAVPVITLCSDSSLERAGVPWMLRTVPRTDDEARALFEDIAAIGSRKPTRWVAFVPDERAGREVSHDLKQAASACHYALQKFFQVSSSGSNIENVTALALRDQPDGVLIWVSAASAGRLAVKLRDAGYKGLMAGPSRLQSRDFFACAGAAADGFMVPGIAGTPQESTRWVSFEDSYRRRWGHDPSLMAGMSYDAARLLIQLLSQDKFRVPPHRVPSGFSWPGVTGDLSFDLQGNRIAKLELLEAHNGRFVRTGQGD